MSKLKENYEKACNDYLKAFCEKHDFDYEDAKTSWVAGIVGTTCMCGDYFVQLEDLILDVENEAEESEFFKWYDYSCECSELGIFSPNYGSWLKGCPRLSPIQKISIRAAKNRVKEAEKNLEKVIEEEKQKIGGNFNGF